MGSDGLKTLSVQEVPPANAVRLRSLPKLRQRSFSDANSQKGQTGAYENLLQRNCPNSSCFVDFFPGRQTLRIDNFEAAESESEFFCASAPPRLCFIVSPCRLSFLCRCLSSVQARLSTSQSGDSLRAICPVGSAPKGADSTRQEPFGQDTRRTVIRPFTFNVL